MTYGVDSVNRSREFVVCVCVYMLVRCYSLLIIQYGNEREKYVCGACAPNAACI